MTPENAATPAVSVILVTYNAWEYTRRCLQHLLRNTFAAGLEVIVVDNDSSDGSAQRTRQTFPTVQVVDAGSNLGFGAACNLGMQLAQGEYIALLNNDALLDSAQLDTLLRVYQQRELNGIYTARIVDENGTEEASCFRDTSPNALLASAFTLMSSALRKATYSLDHEQDKALEIEACSGAFMLFPASLAMNTGGFDENFFMYYEDIDLCRRARLLGYKCYVNAAMSIEHSCGGSAGDHLQRGSLIDTSQRRFYRKHYGRTGAAKARLFQVLRSAPRVLAHALLAFSGNQRRECQLHFRLLRDALSRR